MISIKQAQKIILDNFNVCRTGKLRLLESLGYVLAEDIISPDKLPRFDNSAMDGYALRSKNTKANQYSRFKIVGRIFPGDRVYDLNIRDYECAEIATGAPIPPGADAVIPVEEVTREGEFIYIKRKINKLENIRRQEEDINVGEIVARKGDLITPQLIGLFAALGIVSVKVFLPPSVGIITTGSELVSPDKKRIDKYQIRDTNIILLQALLKSTGIIPTFKKTFADKKGILYRFLKNLRPLPDIIIITGGVSVGRHDYVKEELERFGVKKLFWGVLQKPGKPMYAGIFPGSKSASESTHKTIFLCLPGNPGSATICFYLYVLPIINRFMRKSEIFVKEIYAELENNIIENKGKRTLFLNAHYKNGRVKVFKKQGSHIMSSLGRANAFVWLNPGEIREKGEKVKILLL